VNLISRFHPSLAFPILIPDDLRQRGVADIEAMVKVYSAGTIPRQLGIPNPHPWMNPISIHTFWRSFQHKSLLLFAFRFFVSQNWNNSMNCSLVTAKDSCR
jgi:hypothetical protein